MSHRSPAVFMVILVSLCVFPSVAPAGPPYVVVDTGQSGCYDDKNAIPCPAPGQAFYGQDAEYRGAEPAYRDNGDGTVSDLNTGLMWVKDRGPMITWDEAMRGAKDCRAGGYSDWRAPTIKELYSLIDFTGGQGVTEASSKPYIDTRFFGFRYGDQSAGNRLIDCQDWSSTEYAGTTMNGNPTVFGVNFADGRIKGYPKVEPRNRRAKTLYIRYVRGNPNYGINRFRDNGDGSVTDAATGLTWQKADSGRGLDWKDALAYAESLRLAGHDDWRLPNAKELQSIVDYSRSPAIDPVFSMSDAKGYYWTGTTHLEHGRADAAVYLAFGPAMGYMSIPPGAGSPRLIDVHGAGAQRSDPKSGDPSRFPQGRGPQGDDIRIHNLARCVRGGQVAAVSPAALSNSKDAAYDSQGAASQPEYGSGGQDMGRRGMGGQGMGWSGDPGAGRAAMGGPHGQGGQGGQNGRMGPPPEAFSACSGKASGAQCSFNAPHGLVSGICGQMPSGFVCVPAGGPGGPGGPGGGGAPGWPPPMQ